MCECQVLLYGAISRAETILVWYGNNYGESLGVLTISQRPKKMTIPIQKNPFIL